ncbi:MAG: AAA family ATPase, partial [Candidatus Dormibacteraeota bacterium]|nr:AAA family ATPase [Candidatus Dormibacteraeota bacterium]
MARPRARTGNLPAELTTFVGRGAELREVRTRLADARLVSLVGPGGVGKTRLAIRAATDLGRRFRGGAWLVELAEVGDPVLVANAVAGALDLRDQAATEPRDTLLAHLRARQLLLVLDNCEHLVTATARLLTELLAASPDLRVLATSREPLGVPGEQVVVVPPLELPAEAGEPLERLRQNEAVTLFTERAAAASGRFQLDASNQALVVALCRQLDGLPLAIELAAVRTRALGVDQLLARLRDRFVLLAGGGAGLPRRHRTLATTIDWSYELLRPPEQGLLRRVGVFAGRFALDDAEAVCTSDDLPPGQVVEALSSLVDKSLVMREEAGGRSCYRLHESMRDYAGARLRAADEEALFRERCVVHYLRACSRSAGRARFQLPEWLRWVELEIDNLRGVLGQCLAARDAARGLEIVASLHLYWITHGTTEA